MNLRVPVGFVIAPLIPCAVVVLPSIFERPEWTGGWFLIGNMVVVSQIISLFVAVPVYFLLRRYWRVGLRQCIFSGAAIGVIVSAAVVLLSIGGNYSAGDSGGATVINGQYTLHGWVQAALGVGSMGLLGAGIGLTFWVVAFWSPRRKAPQAQQVVPGDAPKAARP